jgi:hypothetical protein
LPAPPFGLEKVASKISSKDLYDFQIKIFDL